MLSEPQTRTVRVIDDGAAIEVDFGSARHRFHAIWLRDNAQDAATRSPGNGQRLITLNDVPADTRVADARWQGDDLVLHFAPEGREIAHAAPWLLDNAYDHAPAPAARGWTGPGITRWDAALGDDLPVADHGAVCADPAARLSWLRAIARLGFARLTGCPVTPGVPIALAGLFGHVRQTNYGAVFDVRVEANPENLAYTNLGLQAHTDNPYRDPTPGVQILACLTNAAAGGETLLIDGFSVAARLQAEDPAAFDILTRYCARFAYAGTPDVRLEAKAPLIELGVDGELRGVRFNNRSAAPLRDVPYDLVPDWYRACRRMADLIEDPALAVRFRLNPGEAIVFDNLRVLHARTAITGAGSRHLQGCYVDRDGLHSTIAVLERALGC